MRVLIDDHPCPLTSSTVEEAIAEAASVAGERGRLIVEVEVDGRAWSERDLAEVSAHETPVQELRLTTAAPRELVARTLGDASEALVTADELQREAAELIDADAMDKAMERLAGAFEIWSEVQESVSMSAQVLSLGADELDAGGQVLNNAVEKLIEQLREMGRVLKSRDPVGISDALQYEFPDVIREWRAMLDEVRKNLEPGEGSPLMAASAKTRNIDDLMEQASEALSSCRYFETERLSLKALVTARSGNDFERMARIVLPLQEARRQRLQIALDTGVVTVPETGHAEGDPIETGCYLIRPPLVGADARRLRLASLIAEVPIAVLCREPKTLLGLCPIVAICPGTTIRTQIDPPDDPERPDLEWFIWATEELGDYAIASIDPGIDTVKRVDALMDRLNAFPDHEKLHQALEEACRDALKAAANA